LLCRYSFLAISLKHLGLPKCIVTSSLAFPRWILAYARITSKDVIGMHCEESRELLLKTLFSDS